MAYHLVYLFQIQESSQNAKLEVTNFVCFPSFMRAKLIKLVQKMALDQKMILGVHLKQTHIPTVEKEHECEICSEKIIGFDAYKKHIEEIHISADIFNTNSDKF